MLLILFLAISSIVTLVLSISFIIKNNDDKSNGGGPSPSPPSPSPGPGLEACIGRQVPSCSNQQMESLNEDLYLGTRCALSHDSKGTKCVANNESGDGLWIPGTKFGSCGVSGTKCGNGKFPPCIPKLLAPKNNQGKGLNACININKDNMQFYNDSLPESFKELAQSVA